jgi:hypothetical protein
MTQEDINQQIDAAIRYYNIAELADKRGDNFMKEARQAQFRLDSLVYFCNTGKFLDEIPRSRSALRNIHYYKHSLTNNLK